MIRQLLFTGAETAAGACIMKSDLSSDEEQNETDIKDNLALALCQEVWTLSSQQMKIWTNQVCSLEFSWNVKK